MVKGLGSLFPVLVVALVALVVTAPGSTSTAASGCPGGALHCPTFNGTDIINGTLTGADVKDHSLTAKDFKGSVRGPRGSAGSRGPQGSKGDAGAQGPAGLPGPQGAQGPAGPAGVVGPPGPAGPSSALGFASRDVAGSPEAVPSGASNAGVLNLDVPVGTSGYVASSGTVTATAPSRLVATADVTLRNDSAATSTFQCRLARFSAGLSDQLPFGIQADSMVAAGIQATLPITGGLDVAPGAYNVRVQCFTFGVPTPIVFIRGSLTVVLAPR